MKRDYYSKPELDVIVLGEECGLCSGSPCDGGSEDIGYINWN